MTWCMGCNFMKIEVDVWSLGVILYTLLTGGLPFDDDDDIVMREKIIKGEYDDPEWLSDGMAPVSSNRDSQPPDCHHAEARDLIKKVLTQDSLLRLSISQILAHPWFTAHRPSSPTISQKTQPVDLTTEPHQDASSNTSDVSNTSAASEYFPTLASPITTPEQGSEEDGSTSDHGSSAIRRDASDVTINKAGESSGKSKVPQTETVVEEQTPSLTLKVPSTPQQVSRSNSSSKDPPAYPIRTPVRTKRRSVSSALSDHEDSVINTPEPPAAQQNNFTTLLESPAPVIFSTPVEQQLLNSLSSLGFDTGQMVHSVLSDACDSSGSLWWMLIRKAEASDLEQGHSPVAESKSKRASSKKRIDKSRTHDPKQRPSELDAVSAMTRSAPELAFIPATPTASTSVAPTTPPLSTKSRPELSPSSSVDMTKSFPSTPGSSLKDTNKTRKNRAGSVSIMQRATTALEAAGLVRKRSTEAVREEREKEKERHRESERKQGSGEEARSSQGSIPSKRPKSPPAKPEGPAATEYDLDPSQLSSPWIMAKPPKHSSPESPSPTEATSPGDTLTALPNLGGVNSKGGSVGRNRASLLTAFRMWFDEGRRAKRKEAGRSVGLPVVPGTPTNGRARGAVKRRGSSGSKRNSGHRTKHSVSSRRSSSVNSRRSSINMVDGGYQDHVVAMTRQRSDPSRKSYGAHTPNSERGEYSSRPSSVVSGRRHRKSPSQSSSGSMRARTMSPNTNKYHRREGSGSSTRVVKQLHTPHRSRAPSLHVRSDSAASSVHSPESSRRNSFYDQSESEGQRNVSPYRTHRNSFDESTPRRNAATKFVAQKRQAPFMSPLTGSMGRSSWKKAWGVEPPGWQTRATRPTTIEVLAISPAPETSANIRDVFSGRPSLSIGLDDDSDWVDDEEESIPYYVGGVGQLPSTTGSTERQTSTSQPPSPSPGGGFFNEPLTFPPSSTLTNRAPKNRKVSTQWLGSGNTNVRGKGLVSGVGQSSQVVDAFGETMDGRTSRRQLPGGRSTAPVIQEEDEDEEE